MGMRVQPKVVVTEAPVQEQQGQVIPASEGNKRVNRKELAIIAGLIVVVAGMSWRLYSSSSTTSSNTNELQEGYSWIVDEVGKCFETNAKQREDIKQLGEGINASFRLNPLYRTVTGAFMFVTTPVGACFSAFAGLSLTYNALRLCHRVTRIVCCCC